MGIVSTMLHWFMKKRVHQIEMFMQHPFDTQNAVLSNLLFKAKETEYGKKYGFHTISKYTEFKSQIPLVTYEQYEPEIEKTRQGNADIIWPGKIKWFAKSSGTTNAKSKFIPISNESLEESHYKAGKDMFSLYYNNHPDTEIFENKNLRLGGSSELYKGFDTVYGDLSAILIDNLPFWIEYKNTPNKEISLMPEWESKLHAIISTVKNQNIGSLTGVPSWMLVLLQRILTEQNKSYIDEIWPTMEAFFHGGISFTPYKSQYDILFQNPINYYEIYNASEGFFGVQDQVDSKDLLLLLDHGIFYEFIPMDEFYNENPTVMNIEQVQLNINYALVITTNGGLWRYIIGDTVKFTTKNPYRIIVTGRTKHYINAFGEELMIDNAETALDFACKNTNAIINEFTAAPIFMQNKEKGSHEWLIEFKKLPNSVEKFIEFLDQKLKELNSDYEAKRYKNITLNQPKITIAKENLFFEWMKNRGKLGGQNKVPRLANDRQYIDELLKINV